MAKWKEFMVFEETQKPSPMEVVEDYHENKKTPTPLDKQVGGSHYRSMNIQPVEFILANDLGFCEGNAIKYLCRYRQKGGLQDLHKAKHYIEILIDSWQADQQATTEKPD